MTSISFLHGADDRLQAAAAWLAGTACEGAPVVVYVPSGERIERLDRMLWTHPPTGFVPHCRAEDPLAAETPIILASRLDDPLPDACLLNLSDEIPPGFSRFRRLVEMVSIAHDDKVRGRERFRFYRERGYPLEARDISEGR